MELTLDNLRNNAVGKSLPKEELERFHAGYEKEMMIPTRNGLTHVYFYAPSDQGTYPVFINIHGGGFIKGHRDQDFVFCRNIVENAGYAVVDLDYKTAPEHPYPYALHECYDVTEYVVKHPEEFLADSSRLIVGGHSAGANLTLGVEFLALESGAFQPSLLLVDYPGVNFTSEPADQPLAYAPFIRISVEQSRKYNEWYIPNKKDRRELTASPLLAGKNDLKDFPPVLMLLAENDALAPEAVEFTGKLVNAGVTVYAKRVAGADHGFTVRRTAGFEISEKLIFDLFDKVAKGTIV